MGAPDPHVCGYCAAAYVVPSLARWCEQRHEADDTV